MEDRYVILKPFQCQIQNHGSSTALRAPKCNSSRLPTVLRKTVYIRHEQGRLCHPWVCLNSFQAGALIPLKLEHLLQKIEENGFVLQSFILPHPLVLDFSSHLLLRGVSKRKETRHQYEEANTCRPHIHFRSSPRLQQPDLWWCIMD